LKPPLAIALAAALCACAHRPWEDPGPGWRRITSEHFVVDTDGDPAACAPLIDRLEDVHAALSRTFFQGLEVPRVQVLLFDRARDFKAMAPSSNLAGFFHPNAGSGGVLVFSAQAEEFDQVASIAAHELAHRFMRALAPGVPAWLNEGFAEYVEAIEMKDELVVFDASSYLSYATYSSLTPLSQIFAATNRDYHGDSDGSYYRTSWRLVRQIFSSSGPGATDRFRTLARQAAEASTPQQQAAAVSAAMGGLPITEVEERLRSEHLRTQLGVAQATSRRTLAVSLERSPRPQRRIVPVSSAEIRALCREVVGIAPPVAPDPRDRCFAGFLDPEGDPTVAASTGSLEREQVERVVRSHLLAVRGCYDRALKQEPRLAGGLKVRITIAPDGTVARSAILGSTLHSVAVESCIGRQVCRWAFPRPANDGSVTVDYPLFFKYAEAPGP
jgi:hypothetical protein